MCNVDVEYPCGCIVPMTMGNQLKDEVTISDSLWHQGKVCKKHQEQARYKATHWIELGL